MTMTPGDWKQLRDAPAEKQSALLAEFDSAGLFPAPEEETGAFSDRLHRLNIELESLSRGDSDVQDLLSSSPEIPASLRAAAEELTWKIYRFRADWVPGAFSSRETGFFSAGVLLEVDHLLPLIFLHGAFVRRNRRGGYDAVETLAHEMVHAVRIAFPASAYEELFPCQVHASRFRRMAGNLFRHWSVPLFFFGGIAASAVLAAMSCNGWFLPLALPLLTAVREGELRRRFQKASSNLRLAGVEALPVLLRLSDREIREIAALSPGTIAEKGNSSPRWRMLLDRFRIPEAE